MIYNGVDTDNPRIVETIKKMAKEGATKDQICKIVGMPYEVVDKHYQHVKKSGKP